jgi:hypothetical protein
MKRISTRTHTAIGLVVGAALLIAPWLFGFAEVGGPAVTVPILVGLFIIISELTTKSSASPLKIVPMRTHIMMDYLTGAFLALSPWLFSFADLDANAWVPHVIVGIAIIAYAAMTNPVDANDRVDSVNE